MAKIMVVAGGDWQIELIKKAKLMGHYVICSNLYKNSPAFPYSDACEVCDVLDKEGNLRIATKYHPDAIISDQSDIAVPTVAYLNEQLGLKGIGVDKADLFTDKSKMREFCENNHIPVPNYKVCTRPEDAFPILSDFGKIVIKPIDSQSSRGVFTITSTDELFQHWEECISYSNRRKAFLAEEFIGGDEFTIDGLVINGFHYPLCISIKEMNVENSNISKVQTYTYTHPKYDYALLRKLNHELITKAGLPFGLTHSEYKYDHGQFYLIEAGARGGGSNLSAKIVPFMSGIDNYEYYIRSALGEVINDEPIKNFSLPTEKCVIMNFFDFGSGTVSRIEGSQILQESKNILDYQLNVKIGDTLETPKYGRLRPGHFTIGGTDLDELKEEQKRIVDEVHVYFS